MDVDGAEGKVLMGMRHVMKTSVDFLLLELHPLDLFTRHSPGVNRTEVFSVLEQCGFHLFYVVGHQAQLSDGVQRLLRVGRFAYCRLIPDARELLLLDQPAHLFVLCAKVDDLEPILGPSTPDSSGV